jgi:hypothetical protein
MSRYSRLTPALVVFALLSASPVLPQTRPGAAPPRSASFVEALRGFLPEFLTRLWGEEGCGADPYGGACRQRGIAPAARKSPTAVWAEEGCGLDPYGRCLHQFRTPTPNGH